MITQMESFLKAKAAIKLTAVTASVGGTVSNPGGLQNSISPFS